MLLSSIFNAPQGRVAETFKSLLLTLLMHSTGYYNSLYCETPRSWNNPSDEIVQASSFMSFKRACLSFFLTRIPFSSVYLGTMSYISSLQLPMHPTLSYTKNRFCLFGKLDFRTCSLCVLVESKEPNMNFPPFGNGAIYVTLKFVHMRAAARAQAHGNTLHPIATCALTFPTRK